MKAKKEINIQIGEQIKRYREHKHLTQEQFAEQIDVSTQFVSDLERGVVGISISTLKRICTTLDISSDQIIFGETNLHRSGILMGKCRNLSDEDFACLLEIVSKYVEAISRYN